MLIRSDLNTISLTLTDDDTGTATASTSVTVNNVNPTLSNVQVSAASVNENGSITLTGSYADVGSQDTHTLTISWGDGSAPQTVPVSGGSFSVVHQYLDDNPTGTASRSEERRVGQTDEDTGTACASTADTLNNDDPAMCHVHVSVAIVTENGSITLTGSYADVGSQDTHTLTISWGDGSAPQTVPVSGGSFSVVHQYLDDNPTGTAS